MHKLLSFSSCSRAWVCKHGSVPTKNTRQQSLSHREELLPQKPTGRLFGAGVPTDGRKARKRRGLGKDEFSLFLGAQWASGDEEAKGRCDLTII